MFGKRVAEARMNCRAYVEQGIGLRRRPDLIGGGLIRLSRHCKSVFAAI
jgi:hypothetical protein